MTEIEKLIDELGKIDEELAPFTETIKRRAAIERRLKKAVETHAEGKRFAITITATPYEYLDTVRIKKDHGENWIRNYTTSGERRSLKVFKKARKKAAAKKK